MGILRLTAMVVLIGLVVAAVSQAAEEEVLRAPSMEPLYEVDPKYPPAALRNRIQGMVRFEAIIGDDGHVESLRLASVFEVCGSSCRKPQISTTGDALGLGSMHLRKDRRPQKRKSALRLLSAEWEARLGQKFWPNDKTTTRLDKRYYAHR
jgi:hypothetical protein